MTKKRYSVGIDPGFTETGIVVRRVDRKGKLLHAILSCPPNGAAMRRAMILSAEIVDRTMDMLEEINPSFGACEIDYVIETPIWHKKKSNPHAFELQWRLVQQIEADLMATGEGNRITEVAPTTSKKLATGNGGANKRKVADASPFDRKDFETLDNWYTVADAWAHSLAAFGKGTYSTAMNDDKYPEVKHVV